jgi:cytochrome P450
LAIPHFNTKDFQISNYKILVNTNVLIDIQAIDLDSKAWNKPLEFDID